MIPISDRFISKNRPFKKLISLKGIIIHWTANTGKGANAIANANYFDSDQYITLMGGGKKKISASSHFVVDDKRIIRCIPSSEVGYHVGAKKYKSLVYDKLGVPKGDSPNNYTIGIEMCVNEDSNFGVTRQNTIELIKHLLDLYQLSIDNVFRHFDITGKDCPKMLLDDAIWENFLNDVKVFNNSTLKLRVETSELNVRIGPSTNYAVTRKLKSGQIVPKLDQEGLWYKIGSDEWIHSNYVIVL